MLAKNEKQGILCRLFKNDDIFAAKEWVLRNIPPERRLAALRFVLDSARWDGLI